MASSKESVARPVSGSLSRNASSNRPHSNSLSLSATNTTHRIHRRKSVNASASNTAQAAIAAALRDNGKAPASSSSNIRRSIGSKKGNESQSMNARPSMHSYFGPDNQSVSGDREMFDDESMDEAMSTSDKNFIKNRNRRASEGSHLVKGGSKKSELRCDTCGKSYKHSSCLTKHMWEHDPAWAITSKLLISKHQQVQLLEAASVLCNMNAENGDENASSMADIDIVHMEHSDDSSSPLYSGSDEMQDEIESRETTPPSMSDNLYPLEDQKRFSSSSNGFSRSYRSAISSSFADSVVSPGLPPQQLSGVDLRPTTAETDDGSLAAATAGLSFAGTPKSRATFGDDIPPVPPLPQQYQSFNNKSSLSNPFAFNPPSLTQQLSDERNYKNDSEETTQRTRKHDALQEEGMFRMD